MPQQNKVDIVFAGLPWVEGGTPLMAPAVLKSMVQLEGYSAVALDLNIEFTNRLTEKFDNIQDCIDLTNFLVFGNYEDINLKHKIFESFCQEIDHMAERILSYDSKHIGLCLLSMHSQFCTEYLALRIRALDPTKKIVIGGPGLNESITLPDVLDFPEKLIDIGAIDCFITSRGKEGILEYLKGNLGSSDRELNFNPSNTEMDLPYPDYSDYDFDQYPYKCIPILESEGCVQNCEFCDLIVYWPKYKFKQASAFFDEMVYQSKRYGINDFSVRNSLTNGSIKEFQKWLHLIVDYNTENPDNQLTWGGYFIIRPEVYHPEEMFELIGKSNGSLVIGVETPVERVRMSMGKKFTNKDIDFHFEMCQKYNIPNCLLLMLANPDETQEDYKFVQEWVTNLSQYKDNAIKLIVALMTTITPNTEWDKKRKERGWDLMPDNTLTFQQPGVNDFQQRVEHTLIVNNLIRPYQLGKVLFY